MFDPELDSQSHLFEKENAGPNKMLLIQLKINNEFPRREFVFIVSFKLC